MPKPKHLKLTPNEQWVESPLKQFPGGIVVPKHLDPDTFDRFFRATAEEPTQTPNHQHSIYRTFRQAYHLIKSWHLPDVTPEQIDESGRQLPSISILFWAVGATRPLLNEYTSLGELLAASERTTGTTETA